MKRIDFPIPWRVVAIAAGLVVLLSAVGVWLATSGSREPTGNPEVADDAGSEGAATDSVPGSGPAATDEALRSEPGLEIGTELPGVSLGGDEPLDPEVLAGLAGARADRGRMSLRLFLVVSGLEQLVAMEQEVDAPETLSEQVEVAVGELIRWEGIGMVSPLPPETTLHGVFVSPGGIAYIDFDETLLAFLEGGALGEIHAVYGVVTTVTASFPEIRAVQILVGHREIDTLCGHIDVSRPLKPLPDWIASDAGVF